MNGRILALDTTADYGSLALLDGGVVVAERLVHSPDGFAHVLFEELGLLLRDGGWSLPSIDCIAAASGPGGFTGVRVCLTVAKGLAEAEGKPVVLVSNLQAVASFGSRSLRGAVIDAHRGEVYGAVFDARLALLQPPVVTRPDLWLQGLPEGDGELLSADFSPLRGAAAVAWPMRTVPRALAGAIGRIAWDRFLQGAAIDPAAVDAEYVRRSDAEIFWKEAG